MELLFFLKIFRSKGLITIVEEMLMVKNAVRKFKKYKRKFYKFSLNISFMKIM